MPNLDGTGPFGGQNMGRGMGRCNLKARNRINFCRFDGRGGLNRNDKFNGDAPTETNADMKTEIKALKEQISALETIINKIQSRNNETLCEN